MPRTPARFTQDDVKRVLRAVRDLGMGARIDLVNGTIDILPQPIPMPDKKTETNLPYVEDFRM